MCFKDEHTVPAFHILLEVLLVSSMTGCADLSAFSPCFQNGLLSLTQGSVVSFVTDVAPLYRVSHRQLLDEDLAEAERN